MVRKGSSNSEIFAVNERTFTPRHSGEVAEEASQIWQGWQQKSGSNTVLWNNEARTTLIWEYEEKWTRPGPNIWGVIDSSGIPTIIWESEDFADSRKPATCPIISTDNAEDSIIPAGGTLLEILVPGDYYIDSILDLLEVGTKPAWITGSNLDLLPTPTEVANYLWHDQCSMRELPTYPTILDLIAQDMYLPLLRQSILLWLRAASQVLYAHPEETIIPLALATWTVDSVNGIVSFRS